MFQNKTGRKVATKKEQNNNDSKIIGGKKLLGIKPPINNDFVKSGLGKNKSPPTNPAIIDV